MNLDHVFIEVVGNPILGLAAVRTDKKGTVLASFEESVRNTRSKRCVVNAAEFYEVAAGLKAEILGGPNFDPEYVVVACKADAVRQVLDDTYEASFFPRKHWLDLYQLAWPLLYNDLVTKPSLDSLCAHFAIPKTQNKRGTAAGDCEALVRVYWEMMTRYRTALITEQTITSVGGEPLKKVRKFLGW